MCEALQRCSEEGKKPTMQIASDTKALYTLKSSRLEVSRENVLLLKGLAWM